MRELYGHKLYTVQDLINELMMLDPDSEVAFNYNGTVGFSLKEISTDPMFDVVDVTLQKSSDSAGNMFYAEGYDPNAQA